MEKNKKSFKELYEKHRQRISEKRKLTKEERKKIICSICAVIYIIITLLSIFGNSFSIKADDNIDNSEPVGYLVYFNLNYKPTSTERLEIQLGYPPSNLVPLSWDQDPSNLNTTTVYRVATMVINNTSTSYTVSFDAYENNNGELGNYVNVIWIDNNVQSELNLYMPLENYNLMIEKSGEQILPYIEEMETIYSTGNDNPPVITPPNPNITYYEANAKWDIFESVSTSDNKPVYYITEWQNIYAKKTADANSYNTLATILKNLNQTIIYEFNINNNKANVYVDGYQTNSYANNILKWSMFNEIININNIPSPSIDIAIAGASQVIRNIRYNITYTIKTAVIDENGNSATRTELITLNDTHNTSVSFTENDYNNITLFEDLKTKIKNDVTNKGYSLQFTTIEDDIIINLFETTITFYVPTDGELYINEMTYTDSVTPLEDNLFQNVNWFKNNISNGNNYIITNVDTSEKEFNILGTIAKSLDNFFNTDLFGSVSLGEILWFVTGIGMLFALLKYFAGG